MIEMMTRVGTHFFLKKIPRNTAIHKMNIESITAAGYRYRQGRSGTSGCEQVKFPITARLGAASQAKLKHGPCLTSLHV